MNKTDKQKTKTIWPSTIMFTLKDIFELNKNSKEITIRTHLTKEKELGKIVELGALTGGKGRPEKVFTYSPVSMTIINTAKSKKINIADGVESKAITV